MAVCFSQLELPIHRERLPCYQFVRFSIFNHIYKILHTTKIKKRRPEGRRTEGVIRV